MNRAICFASQIKMYCILICLPMRILVPHRRGKTSAVIINILLISNIKEQYISITQDVLTRAKNEKRKIPENSMFSGILVYLSRSVFCGKMISAPTSISTFVIILGAVMPFVYSLRDLSSDKSLSACQQAKQLRSTSLQALLMVWSLLFAGR